MLEKHCQWGLKGKSYHIGLAVVRLLVNLVSNSIASSLGTGGERSIGVFCDVLVGLLAGCGTAALDGLGDVVGCVLF